MHKKPKDKHPTKGAPIQVWIPLDIKERLVVIGQNLGGLSLSSVVRLALAQYANQNRDDPMKKE